MQILEEKQLYKLKKTLFLTMRLSRHYITCNYSDFVRHIYNTGLRREPENEISRVLPNDYKDPYTHRIGYIYIILTSEENQIAGFDAIISSIPAVLGCRDHHSVADLLRQIFPTMQDLTIGLKDLMDHVCENSRRQDIILGLTSTPSSSFGVVGIHA